MFIREKHAKSYGIYLFQKTKTIYSILVIYVGEKHNQNCKFNRDIPKVDALPLIDLMLEATKDLDELDTLVYLCKWQRCTHICDTKQIRI